MHKKDFPPFVIFESIFHQCNETNETTLIHWGQVTHICVGDLTIIGSDNGLLPVQHQAIIWTSGGVLLIGHQEQTSMKFNQHSHIFIQEYASMRWLA